MICAFVVLIAFISLSPAATNDITALVQKGLFEEEANHNLEAAKQHYQTAIGTFDQDRKLIATAVFRLGECYRKQGKTNEAAAQYHRILQEFPDQAELAKLSAEYVRDPIATAQPNSKTDAKQQDLRASWEALKLQETAAKLLFERALKFSPDERINYFTTIDRDAIVEKLASDLAANEALFIQITNTYGPKSPEYQTAKATLNGIKSQIEKRVNALVWSLGQNASALTEQRTAVEKQLQEAMSAEAKKASFAHFQSSNQPEATSTTSSEDEEIRKIKTMIQNSPDLINAPDTTEPITLDSGLEPLQKAAEHGQIKVAEFLVANGANLEGKSGVFVATPLILAAKEGHKAMVELLLEKGAKINAADLHGETALHEAAKRGFKTVAESLLAHGADVNAMATYTGYAGATPLYWAAGTESLVMAELLLAHHADINAKDGQGHTPLVNAILQGQTGMVRFLLEHHADVNIKDKQAETPLHFSVSKGNSDIIQLLLAHKADINAPGNANFTPLLAAMKLHNVQITKLLLYHGANTETQIAENAGYSGGSVQERNLRPLDYAIYHDWPDLVEVLLTHNANPNATFRRYQSEQVWEDDCSPLVLAMSSKYPHLPGYNGTTGLAHAEEMVELLLDHGANPNLAYAKGWTPLHYAVLLKNKKIISALIAHHASLNALNPEGNPPIYYAEGSPEIADLLRQAGADENFARRKSIFMQRNGEKTICFEQGTNTWNHYTLLELIAFRYEGNTSYNNYGANIPKFPDFSHVTIHRLEAGGKTNDIKVDVAAILQTSSADKDVMLQWGDIVELPEQDHLVGESWNGLTKEVQEALQKCLSRTVTITVKGAIKTINILPPLPEAFKLVQINHRTASAAPADEASKNTFTIASSFRLDFVLGYASVIRASSDTAHIKVTRRESSGNKASEIILNLHVGNPGYNSLWLRDGDKIEIPERDPNTPVPGTPVSGYGRPILPGR